jgi:hypothetical protein
MQLSTQRAQPDIASCTGRPAACRRLGVHVARPRARGRVAVEGSRSTRVSAMRTSWRAVADGVPDYGEHLADTTRRTTMRGTSSELRYMQ